MINKIVILFFIPFLTGQMILPEREVTEDFEDWKDWSESTDFHEKPQFEEERGPKEEVEREDALQEYDLYHSDEPTDMVE